MLTHKEWTRINEIILIIHNTSNLEQMREYFLDALRLLVPYDKAMFYLINNQLPEKPILVNVDNSFYLNYLDSINKNKNGRIAMNLRKTISYRDTDYSDNRKKNNDAYLEVLIPNNIEYGGGIIITVDQEAIAELVIYRSKDSEDYSDKELAILDILKEHLLVRLSRKEAVKATIYERLNDYQLTNREFQIVEYLEKDFSNDEIAVALNISKHTAKKHISNIYSKLNINNRRQLLKVLDTKKL